MLRFALERIRRKCCFDAVEKPTGHRQFWLEGARPNEAPDVASDLAEGAVILLDAANQFLGRETRAHKRPNQGPPLAAHLNHRFIVRRIRVIAMLHPCDQSIERWRSKRGNPLLGYIKRYPFVAGAGRADSKKRQRIRKVARYYRQVAVDHLHQSALLKLVW